MGRLFAVMGIIALLIFWPFVIIWALNTVFSLGIAYSFSTWLAMLVIAIAFGNSNISYKKS